MVNMVPPTTQMNLAVLKRYSPQTTAVVTTASYAVVYTFNTKTVIWDRANIEGTLFIVALNNSNPNLSPANDKRRRNRRAPQKPKEHNNNTGPEEYQLIILSRRGLDNFIIPLTSPEDLETSEKFVILRSRTKCGSVETPSGEEEDAVTYGLWVWGEIGTVAGDKKRIEKIVRELSERVVRSKALPPGEPIPRDEPTPTPAAAQQQKQPSYEEENGDNSNSDDAVNGSGNGVGIGNSIGGVPMSARSISLTDLFNQQRKEDEGFSRHSHIYHAQTHLPHHAYPQQHPQHPQQPPQHPQHNLQHNPPQPPAHHSHYQQAPQAPPPSAQHQPPAPPSLQQHHTTSHQQPFLPQPFESYYQTHLAQPQHPLQHPAHHPHPHHTYHPYHNLPHQRHTPSSSQSMPPPPNFLPTPALPAGQPSAYPTPPLPSTNSRPQSQSHLPPVVNYHLGGYAPRMEYPSSSSGGGGGVGLGVGGNTSTNSNASTPGGNDILARLFQSAAAPVGKS